MRQPSPSRRARVRMAAASEPVCGSVRCMEPSHSPEQSLVRYSLFCHSLPWLSSAAATGELVAAIRLEMPPSAAAISSMASA